MSFIDTIRARSGRMIQEDGTIVNQADVIDNITCLFPHNGMKNKKGVFLLE